MYVNWKAKSKSVTLYNDNGSAIRRFTAKAEVIDAHVTGSGQNAQVAITTNNGVTEIYKANGTKIRSSK